MKTYSDLVKQAESAVASVKDPDLRRAAFEKVLDDLILSASNGIPAAKRIVSGKRNRVKPKGSSRQHGPRGYILEMKADGFFAKPKTISEVKTELGNRGHHIPITSLSGPLQSLCQAKELRRQKLGGQTGKKKAFGYSNW